jgi:hypothetical protein
MEGWCGTPQKGDRLPLLTLSDLRLWVTRRFQPLIASAMQRDRRERLYKSPGDNEGRRRVLSWPRQAKSRSSAASGSLWCRCTPRRLAVAALRGT